MIDPYLRFMVTMAAIGVWSLCVNQAKDKSAKFCNTIIHIAIVIVSIIWVW